MRRITDQEHTPLLELISNALSGLPVRDVHDLDGEIRFPNRLLEQILPAFGGEILKGFSLRGPVRNHKHPEILTGYYEDALHICVLDHKRVSFVPCDELLPGRSKVDKANVLRKHPKPFRRYAERLTNPAMSTIGSDQVIGANDIRSSGDVFLESGDHSLLILCKGDEFCAVTHIAAALPNRSKQDRFEPTLRTIPTEWVRADCF